MRLVMSLTSGVTGTPSFRTFPYRDVNPLSRTEKRRLIHAPNDPMREIHVRLIKLLREHWLAPPCVTGSLPECSAVRNVRHHAQNRYFYILDLHNAFPSVDGVRLADQLSRTIPSLGSLDAIQAFLDRYCLDPNGGLRVGAPASPDLFNLYAGWTIDPALLELAERYHLTYTRYLDDLTFSGLRPIGQRKRHAIRAAITQDSTFVVHDRKCRVLDLRKGPIVINGVGLKLGGMLFLPRWYLRRIRGLLHRAMQTDDVSSEQVYGHMGLFWETVRGRSLTSLERTLAANYRYFRLLSNRS